MQPVKQFVMQPHILGIGTWGQNRPEAPVAYKCGIQDLGNSVASVEKLAIRPDTYVLVGKT